MMSRVFLTVLAGCLLVSLARPATAAEPFCSNQAHATPAGVPANLVSRVGKTFQIDDSAVNAAAYVRCVGSKLIACYVGANLICDKADTRRSLTGATAWCRANPGSQFIPMSATGHGTIYQWSCQGPRAIAGNASMHLDRHGYIAENWKDVQ
jgi:aconitase A